MKTYALSWSGGKDSAMALYVARKSGMDVSTLASMMWPGGITASNGVPRAVVEAQARAAGARLLTGAPVDWNGYEPEFRRLLARVKDEGAAGCVFGDIDIADHREWGRRMCSEAGLEAHHPLWGMRHDEAMSEFLRLGFEAFIVVVDLSKMDETWLGRKLDAQAVEELAALGISVAGEFGEYHTLVTGGPVFRESLAGLWEGRDHRVLTRDGHASLDLSSTL
ncbi:MAG: diphthine--ammonia ligase [Ignavibacteriales bacterium]